MEGFGKVFGMFLDGVWEVLGMFGEHVWKVFGFVLVVCWSNVECKKLNLTRGWGVRGRPPPQGLDGRTGRNSCSNLL